MRRVLPKNRRRVYARLGKVRTESKHPSSARNIGSLRSAVSYARGRPHAGLPYGKPGVRIRFRKTGSGTVFPHY